MARLNNAMQTILRNMVHEKAHAKRSALCKELSELENKISDDFNDRLSKAKGQIANVIGAASASIDRILKQNNLKYRERYSRLKYNIESLIDSYGDIISDLSSCIETETGDTETDKRIKEVHEQINMLDDRVSKAQEDIILRAQLGAKYEEVVSMIEKIEL